MISVSTPRCLPWMFALMLSACAEPGPFLEQRQYQRYGPDPIAAGAFFLRAGEPERAKKAFIQALRTDDRKAEALTGIGIAAERQGHLTEARRYFERARSLAPESVIANNNLGVVLFRMGEYSQARQAFRAAFAISNGTSEIARVNLELSNEAIAAARLEADPVVTHRVQRLGSSEFRLLKLYDDSSEG